MTVVEILAEAALHALPDIEALIEGLLKIKADRGDGSAIDAANAAANVGADAIEDTRFPLPNPIIDSLPKVVS